MSDTIDRVVAAIWHLTAQQQTQDEIAKKAQAEIKRLEKQIRALQKVLKTEERMLAEAQRALSAIPGPIPTLDERFAAEDARREAGYNKRHHEAELAIAEGFKDIFPQTYEAIKRQHNQDEGPTTEELDALRDEPTEESPLTKEEEEEFARLARRDAELDEMLELGMIDHETHNRMKAAS